MCVLVCVFIFACIYVHMHVSSVCVCAHLMQRHGDTCPYVCQWRPEEDAGLICHSVPCVLRQGLTLNLELTDVARWTVSEPWGSPCLCLPSVSIPVCAEVGASIWTQVLTLCSSSVPTKPSPSPVRSPHIVGDDFPGCFSRVSVL